MSAFENNELLEYDEDNAEYRDYQKEKEELEKYKEEEIQDWISGLKEIDSQQVYEAAIDKSKSKETLRALKASLLEENPEDSESVKVFARKIQQRK